MLSLYIMTGLPSLFPLGGQLIIGRICHNLLWIFNYLLKLISRIDFFDIVLSSYLIFIKNFEKVVCNFIKEVVLVKHLLDRYLVVGGSRVFLLPQERVGKLR
jgi:hypothetical protein